MIKTTLSIALLSLMLTGCGTTPSTNGNRSNSSSPEVKKGVAPVADSEVAIIEMETPAYGTIKIELYSNIAPKAVARFKELAREGYYNGIQFHRVNASVVQAGDANTKEGATPSATGREGDSGKPNVPAEFSDIQYTAGIVGAARTTDPNSANSQFFITLKREQNFDNKYTIFGKVIEGLNNAVTISGVPKADGSERPSEPVRIKTIRIEPK